MEPEKNVWEDLLESIEQGTLDSTKPRIAARGSGDKLTISCPERSTEVRLVFDPEKQELHLEQDIGETRIRVATYSIIKGKIVLQSVTPREFFDVQILGALRV